MLLKQSFIEKIYRQLGFRKSNSESNFESLKAEVLSILKKQAEKEHNEIKKALKEVDNYFYFEKTLDGKIIQKAGYPVGTVREWKGKKYIKVAPKMWKRKYDKNDRGASISAGKLIKKVEQCKTVEDLMQLVLANKQRFSDENGRPLPIVDKIRAAVDKKNDSFDSETKTVKAPKIEVSESDKKMYYNNASYKYAEIMSSRKIKDIKEGYSKLKDLIQRKKDLFESNKKDIEAGKDSNNKLKTYNAHYEIEIAEYEKIANKVKEYIDSKSKKKETPKTENNSKWEKLSKDEKENKISEYAQNLVNNTDRYSIKDYENLIESIESNKKNLIGGGDDIPKSERINIIKTAMLSLQKESEAEKHANRSEGMKGNQNAKKDGVSEEGSQKNKTEFKELQIPEKTKKDIETFKPLYNKISKIISDSVYSAWRVKNGKELLEKEESNLEAYNDELEEYGKSKSPEVLKEIGKIKDKIKSTEKLIEEIKKYNNSPLGEIIAGQELLNSYKESYDKYMKYAEKEKKADDKKYWEDVAKKQLKYFNDEVDSTQTEIAKYEKQNNSESKDSKEEVSENSQTTNLKTSLSEEEKSKIDIKKFTNKFDKLYYDKEYTPKEASAALKEYTKLMYQNDKFFNTLKDEFNEYRGLTISSDKEKICFMLSMKELEKTEQKESTTENKTLSDVRKKYETSKSVQGNKKTVTLPNGEKIKCHYKLVEADAPTASHDEKTFAKTDGFPTNKDGSTINDRDYAQDKDAQMSVIEIANKYGSQALENPPIVTKDGIVLSGNNRTMSSKLAAKNGTDKAYLDDLKEQIDEFGIDEDELKGFKHPRIILEIDEEHKGDYTTQEMAKYNETGMKTQNTTEKAVKMAKTLTNDSISDIAQSISGCNTLGELYNDEDAVEDFIGRLVKNGILTNQNKAEYVSNGKLSDAGKEFVETVLCGTILNESNIRQMNSEGGRAIRKKIIRALVPLAENKGNGNEYSINKELNQAVEIALRVAKNHNQYKDVQSFITTKDMFDDSETSDLVIKFAEDVHDLGEKNFADKMKSLQAGLRESSNGGINLFLDGCETKEQVLNRVFELKKSIQNILNSLFNRS